MASAHAAATPLVAHHHAPHVPAVVGRASGVIMSEPVAAVAMPALRHAPVAALETRPGAQLTRFVLFANGWVSFLLLLVVFPLSPLIILLVQQTMRAQLRRGLVCSERELILAQADTSVCCLPGCARTGDVVTTVPLDQITDVRITLRAPTYLSPEEPLCRVTVETPSLVVNKDGAVVNAIYIAGVHYDDAQVFRATVLAARDALLEKRYVPAVSPVAVQGAPADRVRSLAAMKADCLISAEEFEREKRRVLESV